MRASTRLQHAVRVSVWVRERFCAVSLFARVCSPIAFGCVGWCAGLFDRSILLAAVLRYFTGMGVRADLLVTESTADHRCGCESRRRPQNTPASVRVFYLFFVCLFLRSFHWRLLLFCCLHVLGFRSFGCFAIRANLTRPHFGDIFRLDHFWEFAMPTKQNTIKSNKKNVLWVVLVLPNKYTKRVFLSRFR